MVQVIMKVRLLALSLLALAAPLPGASVTDRLDRLENQVSEIQLLLNQLNKRLSQPSEIRREPKGRSGRYHVKSGDSYWSIARRHGVTVSALERANPGINPRRLQIGKVLTIPGLTSRSSNSTPVSQSGTGTYTVKTGDILGRISEAHGIRLHQLMSANPGLDPLRLKVGKILNIPGQPRSRTTAALPTEREETTHAPKNQPRKPEATPSARTNPYLTSNASEAPRLEKDIPKAGIEKPRLVQISRDSRLTEIASYYQTTVTHLNKLNDVELSPEQMIQTGSQLYVPGR